MKIRGILFLFLVFLLFSCGAKHDEGNEVVKKAKTDSANQPKLNSVLDDTNSLEKLAAKMIASKETYLNDGNTNPEELFIKALIEALKNPASFKADFENLKKYEINILTANDNKLKVFYWLSPYSGSMWHVQNIIQYLDDSNTLTAVSFNSLYDDKDDEGSPTPFFEHVYALDTSPQKTYLLTGYGQMSGTEPYSVSHALVINNSKFSINKPLFKLGKIVTSQLFASANLEEGETKEKLTKQLAMIYNPKDKTISYPEVNTSKNGFIFNGKRNILTFADGMFK